MPRGAAESPQPRRARVPSSSSSSAAVAARRSLVSAAGLGREAKGREGSEGAAAQPGPRGGGGASQADSQPQAAPNGARPEQRRARPGPDPEADAAVRPPARPRRPPQRSQGTTPEAAGLGLAWRAGAPGQAPRGEVSGSLPPPAGGWPRPGGPGELCLPRAAAAVPREEKGRAGRALDPQGVSSGGLQRIRRPGGLVGAGGGSCSPLCCCPSPVPPELRGEPGTSNPVRPVAVERGAGS